MIIPEGFAQATFIFSGVAVPTGAVTTLGLDLPSPQDPPGDMAAEVLSFFNANFMPLLSASLTLVGCELKLGPNDIGPTGEASIGTVGALNASAVAPNTSILLGKRTQFGGRRGRGRMFLPGCPESLVDSSGILDGTYVGQINSAASGFRDDLIAAQYEPTLFHSEPVILPTPFPIVEFSCSNRVATQRRRLRR